VEQYKITFHHENKYRSIKSLNLYLCPDLNDSKMKTPLKFLDLKEAILNHDQDIESEKLLLIEEILYIKDISVIQQIRELLRKNNKSLGKKK
jgi:hypothetical protein